MINGEQWVGINNPTGNPTPGPGESYVHSHIVRCLKGMLDDENYEKYHSYSDINISSATLLGTSASPPHVYNCILPHLAPKPPPDFSSIRITHVPTHKYLHDEGIPVGKSFTSNTDKPPPAHIPDISHILWTLRIIPTSGLQDFSISPSTIITLLAKDDSSRLSILLTNKFLGLHHFWLQIDMGVGANPYVTSNRECLHT